MSGKGRTKTGTPQVRQSWLENPDGFELDPAKLDCGAQVFFGLE